jgi:hypothetical protein
LSLRCEMLPTCLVGRSIHACQPEPCPMFDGCVALYIPPPIDTRFATNASIRDEADAMRCDAIPPHLFHIVTMQCKCRLLATLQQKRHAVRMNGGVHATNLPSGSNLI